MDAAFEDKVSDPKMFEALKVSLGGGRGVEYKPNVQLLSVRCWTLKAGRLVTR